MQTRIRPPIQTYQGFLVRVIRLILHVVALPLLHDNGVAQGQHHQEPIQELVVQSVSRSCSHIRACPFYAFVGRTIDRAVHRTALELHQVLRECASFVGQDVLHLPDLLAEVEGFAVGRRVGAGLVHFLVRVDEHGLHEIGDLQGDVERNRNHVVEQHEHGEQVAELGGKQRLYLLG